MCLGGPARRPGRRVDKAHPPVAVRSTPAASSQGCKTRYVMRWDVTTERGGLYYVLGDHRYYDYDTYVCRAHIRHLRVPAQGFKRRGPPRSNRCLVALTGLNGKLVGPVRRNALCLLNVLEPPALDTTSLG